MIGILPTALVVGDKSYSINSDFRVVLKIFQAINDDTLSDIEKAYVCVKLLYKDEIPPSLFAKAYEQAVWFCDGGEIPKTEPTKVKTLDWEKDQSILFPAINKTIGFEVRSCQYLHWWTFLGAFGETDEGLFSSVMDIRSKMARGKKLEKYEKDFVKKNKSLFNLVSKEDEEAVKETEDFLKTII